MKVFRSFSIPKKFNDSVIAIGNFDGLHLGHQEVINEAKNILDVEDVIASIFLIEDLRVVKN